MTDKMGGLGAAHIKDEGGYFLPWHPVLSNFLNGHGVSSEEALRLELVHFLKEKRILK
jgi:hypothetical protein